MAKRFNGPFRLMRREIIGILREEGFDVTQNEHPAFYEVSSRSQEVGRIDVYKKAGIIEVSVYLQYATKVAASLPVPVAEGRQDGKAIFTFRP